MGREAAGRCGRADAALGLLADRVAEQTAIEQAADMSRAAARMPRSAYLPIESPSRPPPSDPPISVAQPPADAADAAAPMLRSAYLPIKSPSRPPLSSPPI
ncbi:hypothetical protein KGP93_22275 [Burkholderia multivorans]|nr:hypothetical protein [Burkholderia multivorans]